MKTTKTVRVWEVLFDLYSATDDTPEMSIYRCQGGDDMGIARTLDEKLANEFAATVTCYGQKAKPVPMETPARLVRNWGI